MGAGVFLRGRGTGPVVGRRGSLSGPAVRDSSLHEAERLVTEGAKLVGLALDEVALAGVAKGDRRKVVLAMVLRRRSIASNGWISEHLAMGAAGSVSRLVAAALRDRGMISEVEKLEEMLKCEDWYHFHTVRSRRASLKGSLSPDCFGG